MGKVDNLSDLKSRPFEVRRFISLGHCCIRVDFYWVRNKRRLELLRLLKCRQTRTAPLFLNYGGNTSVEID